MASSLQWLGSEANSVLHKCMFLLATTLPRLDKTAGLESDFISEDLEVRGQGVGVVAR